MRTSFFIVLTTFLAMFFISCSPQAGIRLNTDNSASISFKMDSGNIIQSILQGMGMTAENESLFNSDQVKTALSEAGLTVTALSFPSKTALNLTASCPDIQKLLPEQSGFIRLSKTVATNSLKLTISPQTIRQITGLMPAETADFLDLLVAPVFTDEKMLPTEYVDLIGIAYGASAATELKKAQLSFSISVPSLIKTATVSNTDAAIAVISGNTVTFTLNLVPFLTDLRTTDYEITW